MDQLIALLEQKINTLTSELKSAKQEICDLRSQINLTDTQPPQIEPDPLLSSMEGLAAADQLQLYIADSLDLSEAPKNTQENEEQLSFDLNSTPIFNDIFADADADADSPVLQPKSQQRNKNQKNNLRLVKLLESRYPKAFNWNNPRPLKVGIDQDITLDEELTQSKLKRALAAYTRSNRYKKCLSKNDQRIDLDGNPIKAEKNTPKAAKKIKKSSHKQAIKKDDNDEYQDLSSEDRMKLKLAKLTGNNF